MRSSSGAFGIRSDTGKVSANLTSQSFSYHETQSKALFLSSKRIILTRECLKEIRQESLRDTWACVFDIDDDESGLWTERSRDLDLALLGEFNSVEKDTGHQFRKVTFIDCSPLMWDHVFFHLEMTYQTWSRALGGRPTTPQA